MDANAPPDSSAAEVLAELGKRYQRFQVRNRNYARLITYLCFVGLFLATLFLQRNAHVSYQVCRPFPKSSATAYAMCCSKAATNVPCALQVYSTVASKLLPDPASIGTTDDIYTWLAELLQNVWQDPVCGDGVCEVPFEYAAYGRLVLASIY